MDESTLDPAPVAETTEAPDTPVETPVAPDEQGTSAEPAPEAEAHDEGGYLRHADYTRKTMELAEQRRAFEAEQQSLAEHKSLLDRIQQDPHLQQQLNEYFSEPDNPDEFADPFEQKLNELDQRQQALEQREQSQRQEAADLQSLQQDLDDIARLRGNKPLSEDEITLLGRFAGRDDKGRLGVADAYQALDGLFEIRRQEWIAGKTAAAAAPTPPGGQQGSEKFDINDRDSRIQRLAAVLQGNG